MIRAGRHRRHPLKVPDSPGLTTAVPPGHCRLATAGGSLATAGESLATAGESLATAGESDAASATQ